MSINSNNSGANKQQNGGGGSQQRQPSQSDAVQKRVQDQTHKTLSTPKK
jgi:hypothetical protein